MNDSYRHRIEEMIESALRLRGGEVVAVEDIGQLRQAIELGRLLEPEQFSSLLRRWVWREGIAGLFEAVLGDAARTTHEVRHLALCLVLHHCRQNMRRIEKDKLFINEIRAILNGRPGCPSRRGVMYRLIVRGCRQQPFRLVLGELVLQQLSLTDFFRHLRASGWSDDDWLQHQVLQRTCAFLADAPVNEHLIHLTAYVERAVVIGETGEVVEVVDQQSLRQAIVLGRVFDVELLIRALSWVRWPAQAYPLLLAAADGEHSIAARECRLFACDCLEQVEPDNPLIERGRRMAWGERGAGRDGGELVTDRSPSRAARKTATILQERAGEGGLDVGKRQQGLLLDRVRDLLSG